VSNVSTRNNIVYKKNFNQPSLVKKSYLYLGIPALMNIKNNIDIKNLQLYKSDWFFGKTM